jgi:hypothetical protein
MKSAALGRHTLAVEVTNISPHGLWVLLDGREVFVSFRDFPWFAEATVQQLIQVRRPSPHHLHWPALDVDLAVESLDHPERFPLVSRVRSNQRLQLPRARPASGKRGSRRVRPRS